MFIPSKGVSVIICSYNSAERLPKTLSYLASQEIRDNIPWEVIVVDNNSTDKTGKVAAFEWDRLGSLAKLRIVPEKKSGLIYARQKGINSASYEYLIFCDDDNWLCKSYVERVFDYFEKLPENAGIIGGFGEAVFENQFSEKKKYSVIATGPQSSGEGDISKREALVYGAGMAIKKKVFESFGNNSYKFFLTGRKGGIQLSGEDEEICRLALISGFKIHYYSDLRFFHYMPEGRFSIQKRKSGIIGLANSKFYLNLYSLIIFSTKSNFLLIFYPLIALWTTLLFLFRKPDPMKYSSSEIVLLAKERTKNVFRSFFTYYFNLPYFYRLNSLANNLKVTRS